MKMVKNRIMVQQYKTEAVTKGGITLPEASRQVLPYGVVMKVGPDANEVKRGDVILFSEIGAISLGVLKPNCVLIEPDDILAILEEGDY
ncbi:hypothetical protein LCGC14_0549260 [marine sediment metagenome]|uniref:10 kDa chaperonin n=1 Tax=marine sediment metagenome TaxID=412755 RepID=A0A0F9S8Z1_9ZZZZ